MDEHGDAVGLNLSLSLGSSSSSWPTSKQHFLPPNASSFDLTNMTEEDIASDAQTATARKKMRLSQEQAAILEEAFKEFKIPNEEQKEKLAKDLNLNTRQVKVWFQNRRARTKLTKPMIDCGYLRRNCQDLSEENKRLQKEVNELKALKHSPQVDVKVNPPFTISLCPKCLRVVVTSSSSASDSSTLVTTGVHHPPIMDK